VKKTAQVKAAFKVMKSKTLNGLAVVEESGALVGNVSASDLKYIGTSKFSRLRLSLFNVVV